jgi:hypothetical protein
MSKIRLSHKEKTYILEYNRNNAMMIERNGFALEKLTEQPNVQIPLLVRGAFLMHHSKLKEKKIWEIFEGQKDKSGLITTLATMYQETVTSLVGDEDEEVDEKNATWELV